MKKISIISLIIAIVSCTEASKTENPASTPLKSIQEQVEEIIQPPVEYNPTAILEGSVNSTEYMGAERHDFNLIFEDRPVDSLVILEMRYWMYQVWDDYRYTDGIYVKCFDMVEPMAFATGTFAPEGEWSKVNNGATYQSFDVSFKVNH